MSWFRTPTIRPADVQMNNTGSCARVGCFTLPACKPPDLEHLAEVTDMSTTPEEQYSTQSQAFRGSSCQGG